MKLVNKALTVFAMVAASIGYTGCGAVPADANVSNGGIINDGVAEAGSFAVVDTGQNGCYDDWGIGIDCPGSGENFYGQDAQYVGAVSDYTDNGDGTVTDNNTGLMWQQDPGDKVTYDEAVSGADDFNLVGYDDWRLPTIKELYSLILFSGLDVNPSSESGGPTPFIDTTYFAFEYGDTSAGDRIIDSQWATSNIYEASVMGGEECFFGVNFADGRIKCYPTTHKTYFTLYVREASGYGENDYEDNGDGTVTDNATGLIWMQDDSGKGMNWEEALAFCEANEIAGHIDWRLPNAKELQSIVDYSRSPSTTDSAAIDPIFNVTSIVDEGGSTNYPFYWTSTNHISQALDASAAIYIAFGEALGWMQSRYGDYELMDVHGAGAQRSDPKIGNPEDYPYGRGPQGDVIRINNYARCVRTAN